MPVHYYEDLSADDHGEDSSSSDSSDDGGELKQSASSVATSSRQSPSPVSSRQQTLWQKSPDSQGKLPSQKTQSDAGSFKRRGVSPADDDRCILHVDVDCFYCQCEMLDRKLPADRPIAIGQKHIIVTCNYAARAVGVGKLELREKAYAKCPNLLILEGSDLERYRVHGRKVYEAFRTACKGFSQDIAVCKGSMDEMMADLTPVFSSLDAIDDAAADDEKSKIFVYGQDSNKRIDLVEDQSGDAVCVRSGKTNSANNSRDSRLERAASAVALKIRHQILQETGFTVTMGLSINPLLAKLASGLVKPGTANVLYPQHAQTLVPQMPLRKIPGIGSRTMKLLRPALAQQHRDLTKRAENAADKEVVWTCGDLSEVSDAQLVECLRKLPGSDQTRSSLLRKLRSLCVGMDESDVVDDGGGLSKVVSCENSFRRGTVRTRDAVLGALAELYRRLPKLVAHRVQWSHKREQAFATTLRLTVRLVDPKAAAKSGRSRPFVTKSKQCRFDGRAYARLRTSQLQAQFLQRCVQPLAETAFLRSASSTASARAAPLDVTRISIALDNFQDAATT